MVKAAKSKPKAATKAARTSSLPFGGRSVVIGVVGIGIAVLGQFMLTQGYFSSPPPPPPPKAGMRPTAANPKAAAAAGPPAVCPDDWKECPRVAGVDWVALEATAITVPTATELDACHQPSSLLSPRKVPGMHLLCVLPPPVGSAAASLLAIFPHMQRDAPVELLLLPPLKKAEHVASALTRKLAISKKGPKYQHPALFSTSGVRLKTAQMLASAGADAAPARLLCMAGGQWLWPPVDVGHVHVIPDLTAPGVETRVVTVSLRPLVVEVENFLNPEEAHHIINRAKPHMAKSGVALKDADRGKAAKEFRTSSQYFLPTTHDQMLEKVDKRVMHLTRIPITHAEYIQVLMYNQGEHYSAHHDFFDPAAYASNPQMLESVEHGAKNRLATVFFYLNNVTDHADLTVGGGQTNFPRAATAQFPNGGPQPFDFFDCTKGLSVYPQEGKVIIFYSMLPDGTMDDYSLHAGCDPLDATATKWSANFWLWNKPYHFVDPARKAATQEWVDAYL